MLMLICKLSQSTKGKKSKKAQKVWGGNRIHRIENSSLEKGTGGVKKQCWVSMTITTNGATTPTREMYTHAAKCYAEKTNNKDLLRRSRSRDGEETTNKQSLVSKCLFDEIDGTFL
jgi:hypothetical protein